MLVLYQEPAILIAARGVVAVPARRVASAEGTGQRRAVGVPRARRDACACRLLGACSRSSRGVSGSSRRRMSRRLRRAPRVLRARSRRRHARPSSGFPSRSPTGCSLLALAAQAVVRESWRSARMRELPLVGGLAAAFTVGVDRDGRHRRRARRSPAASTRSRFGPAPCAWEVDASFSGSSSVQVARRGRDRGARRRVGRPRSAGGAPPPPRPGAGRRPPERLRA